MTTFETSRAFAHRRFGDIGQVAFTMDATKVMLDGTELPPRSVEYLMTFALQSLQDAYAGSDSADEAQAAFAKKLDAIKAGTIGVRTGGGGKPAHWKFVRAILRGALKAKKAAYDALETAAERNEFLDEAFAGLPEATQKKVEKTAREQLAVELAAREKGSELDLDV